MLPVMFCFLWMVVPQGRIIYYSTSIDTLISGILCIYEVIHYKKKKVFKVQKVEKGIE